MATRVLTGGSLNAVNSISPRITALWACVEPKKSKLDRDRPRRSRSSRIETVTVEGKLPRNPAPRAQIALSTCASTRERAATDHSVIRGVYLAGSSARIAAQSAGRRTGKDRGSLARFSGVKCWTNLMSVGVRRAWRRTFNFSAGRGWASVNSISLP